MQTWVLEQEQKWEQKLYNDGTTSSRDIQPNLQLQHLSHMCDYHIHTHKILPVSLQFAVKTKLNVHLKRVYIVVSRQ